MNIHGQIKEYITSRPEPKRNEMEALLAATTENELTFCTKSCVNRECCASCDSNTSKIILWTLL